MNRGSPLFWGSSSPDPDLYHIAFTQASYYLYLRLWIPDSDPSHNYSTGAWSLIWRVTVCPRSSDPFYIVTTWWPRSYELQQDFSYLFLFTLRTNHNTTVSSPLHLTSNMAFSVLVFSTNRLLGLPNVVQVFRGNRLTLMSHDQSFFVWYVQDVFTYFMILVKTYWTLSSRTIAWLYFSPYNWLVYQIQTNFPRTKDHATASE